MTRFFQIFAVICAGLFLVTLTTAQFPTLLDLSSAQHMLLGLTTAILTVSLHCLIFGIFTGSGKDTRLLVEDLSLESTYVKRAKQFKREIFPPALYAILFILVLTSLGGFLSANPGVVWIHWVHWGAGWLVFAYNLKVFWIEARGVAENRRLLDEVNRVAASKPASEAKDEVVPGAIEQFGWETHVYALGKFLTFMGYNSWLPYIYLRFIVGNLRTPFWPFLGLSCLFLAVGFYLRWQYRAHRPGRGVPPASEPASS